jgi:predicted alpha/beta hydrolase
VRRVLEAADGWRLDVVDLEPRAPARAVCLVGHAMMVDRRSIWREDRPSLAATLCDEGHRVLALDLRGHGASGPTAAEGASWSYDDLLGDVGLYVAHAAEVAPGLPIVLVGNSLFGHLALAWLGLHPDAPVAAVVGFAVNIWNRRWTPDRTRWWKKLAVIAASAPVTMALGRLPVRRLGLGTADEPLAYWRQMFDWVPHDRWTGSQGDYAALMSRVKRPFLHVVSDGDRLLCHPDDALPFGAALGEHRRFLRLGARCDVPELRGLEPGHVEMVSSPRCEPLWRWTARWIAANSGV